MRNSVVDSHEMPVAHGPWAPARRKLQSRLAIDVGRAVRRALCGGGLRSRSRRGVRSRHVGSGAARAGCPFGALLARPSVGRVTGEPDEDPESSPPPGCRITQSQSHGRSTAADVSLSAIASARFECRLPVVPDAGNAASAGRGWPPERILRRDHLRARLSGRIARSRSGSNAVFEEPAGVLIVARAPRSPAVEIAPPA